LLAFNKTRISSTDLKKKIKYQISLKSVYREPSCSIHAGGQTNRHDEANSRFSQCWYRAWKLLYH